MLDPEMCSSKERRLRPIVLALSTVAWLALVVSIVGALYGVFIAAFIAVAHALFLAHVAGNGLRLSSNQLPEIWAKVVSASRRLGLPRPPEAYVLQSGGLLNAFATKLLSRRVVIITSDLIDAAAEARSAEARPDAPDLLDFIVAHEVGHVAGGHLSWFVLPARVIPIVGAAWSRACEYTSDLCGYKVVGDLETSSRALAMLAAGGATARRVNLDAFVEQRAETGGFWMAVYELNASHPYLPKRVAALRAAAMPGYEPSPGRNPLAYPLAPVFAIASGGSGASAMTIVAIIGIMAAIALPAFSRYMQRTRATEGRAPATYDDPRPAQGSF